MGSCLNPVELVQAEIITKNNNSKNLKNILIYLYMILQIKIY